MSERQQTSNSERERERERERIRLATKRAPKRILNSTSEGDLPLKGADDCSKNSRTIRKSLGGPRDLWKRLRSTWLVNMQFSDGRTPNKFPPTVETPSSYVCAYTYVYVCDRHEGETHVATISDLMGPNRNIQISIDLRTFYLQFKKNILSSRNRRVLMQMPIHITEILASESQT